MICRSGCRPVVRGNGTDDGGMAVKDVPRDIPRHAATVWGLEVECSRRAAIASKVEGRRLLTARPSNAARGVETEEGGEGGRLLNEDPTKLHHPTPRQERMLPVVGVVLEEIRKAAFGQSTKGSSATLKVATLNSLDYLVADGMKVNGVTAT